MKREEAIKIVKSYYPANKQMLNEALEFLIPELTENEDEKIVNEIISYLNSRVATSEETELLYFKRWIAWLEKQGKSSDQIHYWTEEEIEPIINDYLRGVEHYGGMIGRLRCLKPKSLEKQGESDETKAKMFLINKGYPIDANGIFPTYEEMYNIIKDGLEKQSSNSVKWQKNTPDNKPTIRHSVLMKTIQGIAEGEWQGEYWFQYRWSWTLKDSDVLAWMELSDLNEQGEQNPTSDTRYEVGAGGSLSVNEKPFDYEKATITQKDFVPEQELKKVEDEIEVPFGAKDSELQEETYYIPKGFYAIIDDDKVVIKKGEKSATWSDEDERMIETIIRHLESQKNYQTNTTNIEQCQDWLKSLKPQR